MTSTKTSPIGLAFSGGGIRSAAFCSGVLRRLLRRNVQVDYLSCVSGGGYTGTAFLDWKYREEKKDSGEWHRRFFGHMRERAGYFCNWEKPLEGILDTAILVCLVVLVNVIGPIVTWGSYACPVAYIIDLLFGQYLRKKSDCEDVGNSANTAHAQSVVPEEIKKNATKEEIKRYCLSRQGTDDSYTFIFFFVLFVLFAVFFVLSRKTRKPYSTYFSFIYTIFFIFLALTFLPFTIHDIIIKIPIWAQCLVVVVGILLWFSLPLLRTKTSYVLMMYLFSYVTYWKVYEGTIVGVAYSSEIFNRWLFLSGLALWFVPSVTALHVRLTHVYNRWRLQKAFYHPDGLGEYGCAGIGLKDICPLWTCLSSRPTDANDEDGEKKKGSLNLKDLEQMKSEYLSNITVNRWKRNDESDKDYEILTMSPSVIERLDRRPQEKQFEGKLKPKDVKLSNAMATSAAAISMHMGKYDTSVEGLTRFHTLLGLEMGARMISDIQAVKKENILWKIMPILIDILRALPLMSGPATYWSDAYETTETTIKQGVFSFGLIHFVLALIAVIDTGKKNPKWPRLEKLARWFIVHNYFVQFMRDVFSKDNTGLMPPPIMLLSDGGHVENLGLLPLLKKRLQKIIVVDGGYKDDQKLYGESLLNALMLARTKLNCSFLSASDGGDFDVITNLMNTFVKPRGNQGKRQEKLPRVYKFKVRYDRNEAGNRYGEVLLITPREPKNGVDLKPTPLDPEPFDKVNGLRKGMILYQDEVDDLTFCCCECCHGHQCCGLSNFCCNTFPQHSTANQFFTARMFEAYHREGYRACVEAEQDGFMEHIVEQEPDHNTNAYHVV